MNIFKSTTFGAFRLPMENSTTPDFGAHVSARSSSIADASLAQTGDADAAAHTSLTLALDAQPRQSQERLHLDQTAATLVAQAGATTALDDTQPDAQQPHIQAGAPGLDPTLGHEQPPPTEFVALPTTCGLWGCTLSRLHTGQCNVVAPSGSRQRKKPPSFLAEPAADPRVLAREARSNMVGQPPKRKRPVHPPPAPASSTDGGNAAPVSKTGKRIRTQKRKSTKRKRGGGTDGPRPPRPPPQLDEHGRPIPRCKKREPAAPRAPLRLVTRSKGEAEWDAVAARDTSMADTSSSGETANLPRNLRSLQDFLPKGLRDPAANQNWTSLQAEVLDQRAAERGITFGCRCKGHVRSAGRELRCRSCEKWFHSKCERLDATSEELDSMQRLNTFECGACELSRLRAHGFDPDKGRFAFRCRTCGCVFDDEIKASSHGRRCMQKNFKRQWSCPCNGARQRVASALECKSCGGLFHKHCVEEVLPAGEETQDSDRCLSCHRSDLPRRPDRSAARAETVEREHAEFMRMLKTRQPEYVRGCLADGRIYVDRSRLPNAGLGLFAGVAYRKGEEITTYDGPIVYRQQIAEEADKSYVLRIPNAGGVVIDGKAIADAIRSREGNPGPDGHHVPPDGSEWWYRGAASMANDPREAKLYNAHISFSNYVGINRHLSEIAPMRAMLVCTRDIAAREEIHFRYGSDKPFEYELNVARAHALNARREKELRNSYRRVWIPYPTETQVPAAGEAVPDE